MKKNKITALICTLVFLMTLMIPVFATTARASEQIKLYMMDTIVTKGAVNIEFSITGK